MYSTAKDIDVPNLKEKCINFMICKSIFSKFWRSSAEFEAISQVPKFKEIIAEDEEILSKLPPEMLASFVFHNFETGIIHYSLKRKRNESGQMETDIEVKEKAAKPLLPGSKWRERVTEEPTKC